MGTKNECKACGASANVEDKALLLLDHVVKNCYSDGLHITRSVSEDFWVFRDTHWTKRLDSQISKIVLRELRALPLSREGGVSSILDQAMRLMRSELMQEDDLFGFTSIPKSIINVRNGEIHIDKKTGEHVFIKQHLPANYQTYCLQVDYDQDATCPRYDQALLEIFGGDKELVRHWHEFFGYAIQAARDIPTIWLLHGEGENGKTYLTRTIYEKFMNEDAAAAISVDQLHERFQVSQLFGKLIGFDDDVNQNTKLPDGILKRLSETKKMSAEFKGRDHFGFTCYSLIVLLCNGWPITSDVSHGMQRRVQVIPFRQNFAKTKDPDLFPYIWENELSGVLNRALQGLRRVRQRRDFAPPPACLQAKLEWLGSANPVQLFLSEEFERDIHAMPLPRSGIYKHYEVWIKESGLRFPVGRNKLIKMLEQLGMSAIRHYNDWCYMDLRLTNADMNQLYKRIGSK